VERGENFDLQIITEVTQTISGSWQRTANEAGLPQLRKKKWRENRFYQQVREYDKNQMNANDNVADRIANQSIRCCILFACTLEPKPTKLFVKSGCNLIRSLRFYSANANVNVIKEPHSI